MKLWPNLHGLTVQFYSIEKGLQAMLGYIQVPPGVSPKAGEGGRHLAARAISQLAEGIAICVSSSGTITMYAKGRDRYKVRLG